MNKLKLGILFLIGIFAISGLAMAQGENENANSIQSPEQKQAKPLNEKFAPDQIIVKFKEGTSDETISMINSKNKVVSSEKIIKKNLKAVENEKTKILKKHGLDRIYLLKLQKNTDVNEMVGKYNQNQDVEYAEPNYKVYVDATIPNDDYFSQLWGMHNTNDADIDAPEAWDITTGSDAIVVAVIDSGVDYNHMDLAANIWNNTGEIPGNNIDDDGNGYIDDTRGWDFCRYGQTPDNDPMDDNGHGTHCSGTIAAVGNNGVGIVGVSWNAKIMPLKFLGSAGTGYTSDAIPAIQYAIDNGADIMSNSWGGGSYLQSLEDAISAANDAGILFVAAAGNDYANNDMSPHYPSSYDVPNVVAVAATDHNDLKASFSNYGLTSVDLGAPGVNTYSTIPGDSYGYKSGTSMATPHVAGAAALVLAQNSSLSVAELKAKILDSVDPIDSLAGKTVTGGRLNVYNCFDPNPQPELSVAATSPAKVNNGTTFTVEAVISNTGIETATGVNATITLPTGLTTSEPMTKIIGDIESASPASVSWVVNADNEGTHNILVTASATNADEANDTTTTEAVIPDTELPAVTLQSPIDADTIAEGNIVFQYIPDDTHSGISSCELTIDGDTYIVNNTITEGVTNEFTVWMTAGNYTWNVRCTDDSPDANEGSGTERTLTVEDQTPPTNGFIIIANDNGITDNAEPDMYLNATGADSMAFSCDDTAFSNWIPFDSIHTDFNINTGAGCTQGDGPKTVYVKFKDNAGNEGAHASDTTILDTTAPIISEITTSDITSMTATITWTTDEPADSVINYGEATTLGSSISNAIMTTDHSITLTGLSMGTEYYYEVESTDYIGHITTDNNGGEYYTYTTVPVSPKTITSTPDSATDTIGNDVTAQVQASDDTYATLNVRKGSGHVEMNFVADIPDGSAINSVIFSYEHHETIYDAVYIEVLDGSTWTRYDGTISASEIIESEDITAILDTETKAESSTIRYVCQHTLGKPEKCYLDHAKLEIAYTPLLPEPASLSVTVTSTASIVNEGDSFIVDAVISNSGDEIAIDVEAIIDLPAGLSTIDDSVEIGTLSGGESTTVSWLVNADTAGPYNITVTASATDTDPASDTTTVNVITPGDNVMHIASIDMSTIKVAPNIKAIAKVTIVDANDAPVEGVAVSGTWSGLTTETDYGLTDASGQVSLGSDELKKPVGTYNFTVDVVTKDGWTYDSGISVTSGSITVA